MSTTRLIVSYSLSKLHIKPRSNSQTCFIFNPSRFLAISKQDDGSCFRGNGGFRYLSSGRRARRNGDSKMDLVVNSSVQPGPPPPSQAPPNSWKNWILGSLIAIILPFFRNKWGPLFKLTKDVEEAVERVEHVTEVIEKVAEGVEKVAEDIGDELPEGGKLRSAIEKVENAAKEAEKVAHLAEEIIDKVEKVDKDVESFMEPVKDQPNGEAKEENDKK